MTTRPDQNACPYHAQTAPTQGASLTRRELPEAHTALGDGPDEHGIYRLHDFASAREILRSEGVSQAGFMAEQARSVGAIKNQPVLFAEGEEHHEMRRDTARYFTPAAVSGYHPMIARLADDLISDLARHGELNLDDLSLRLAVGVAARVVGLTSSRVPGLERRVIAFVEGDGDSEPGRARKGGRIAALRQQTNLALFYALDVKPAIQARRKERRDDLISHLIDRNYSDVEIMTECLTYGTAGMVTTREFISVAAWHLLQNPELRAEYIHGTEAERHALLHEILRLEPVVGTLYRRTTRELKIGERSIPAGSVVALNLQQANTDPAVAGDDAAQLCPARTLPRGVQGPVLSFGDGHHRCPGAFLAIRESDVLLRRLLVWNDLRIVRPPTVSYNEVVKGYELRNFRIALG